MATQEPRWEIKGIYNEACASEGHCLHRHIDAATGNALYQGRGQPGGYGYRKDYKGPYFPIGEGPHLSNSRSDILPGDGDIPYLRRKHPRYDKPGCRYHQN